MNQAWGIGIPDTFIAPCSVCGDPGCYAEHTYIRAANEALALYRKINQRYHGLWKTHPNKTRMGRIRYRAWLRWMRRIGAR